MHFGKLITKWYTNTANRSLGDVAFLGKADWGEHINVLTKEPSLNPLLVFATGWSLQTLHRCINVTASRRSCPYSQSIANFCAKDPEKNYFL